MFKKIRNIFIIVFSLAIVFGGIYTISNLYNQKEEYRKYKEKVEDVTKKNFELTEKNNDYLIELEVKEKDRATLIERLKNQEKTIVTKEKIVYKDGKLVIPDDYESTKENYIILSELYQEKNKMYDALKDQSNKDYETIEELKKMLKEVQSINQELVNLLNNPVTEPKKLFTNNLFGGVGITPLNTYSIKVGYGVQIASKYQLIALVEYPFELSLLFGIQL